MAKGVDSLILSRLSKVYKVLEEQKQALLDAKKQPDSATEGKLAMKQELRTWREEHGGRCKAGKASKSEAKPSNMLAIVVHCKGDSEFFCCWVMHLALVLGSDTVTHLIQSYFICSFLYSS